MIEVELSEFKNNLISSKKYWIIYLIFMSISTFSMISQRNFANPAMEVFFLILVAIIGLVCISYSYSKYSEKDLHKIAFVIIIIFGLLCVFTMPILEPSDAHEHLARAEITSRGILFPEYTGENYTNYYFNGTDYVWTGEGFQVIQSIKDLSYGRYDTVETFGHDTDKINNSLVVVDQCFEQNPFYGYLPQALGIIIAKLLDLNLIWLLWLPRLFNILCYATIASYAVKKAPIFKIPIIVAACLPLSMFQAASVSIDSMIISVGLLVIAYFFYFCNTSEISIKEMGIFLVLTLLLGLMKLPYLAFSLLIFAVPFNNFKNKNMVFYSFLGIFIIGIIGMAWSNYATGALWHSYRATYYLNYNVNSTLQMNYLLSDNLNPILFGSRVLEILKTFMEGSFVIVPNGSGGYMAPSNFVASILPLFMGCVFLAYPFTEKFSFKSKFVSLLVLIIIYAGTALVQFLTWCPSGQLVISGVNPRYFLPLLALVPFIFGFNKVKEKNIEFDHYILTLTISFMAIMVMAFIFKFY